MKRRLTLILASLVTAGCAAPLSTTQTKLPYLAIFKPPPPGREHILLLAAGSPWIRIDRDCVLIGNARAGYSLPIFYQGTTVGKDGRGYYLRDAKNGIKFRDGDRARTGGGESPFTGREIDRVLVEPVPDVCLTRAKGRAGSVNPGMRRF